jgi:hypothetical protein
MTTPIRFGIAKRRRFAISPSTAGVAIFPGHDRWS